MKVAFVGSDGSGKSSLISYARRALEREGRRVDVVFMGWRDFKNPLLRFASGIYLGRKRDRYGRERNLGKIGNARAIESWKEGEENRLGVDIIGKRKLERFRPRGWFFYLIYYLEMWGRYLGVLYSKADFVFLDRYFYDELAFASGGKLRFFRLITPKPDLCFILKIKREELKRRGVAVTEKNYENFYGHLDKIGGECNCVEIDSSGSVEESFQKIKKYL